jgi:2-succinyl-6-hydroxy-2,4-cyclohexadiene-1-carboxylate synthase
VLWVHGYTVDSTIWNAIWDLLPEWSHYGIDLPGHGLSPPLRAGMTLRELASQLADAATRFGIQHVVGLSLGTMIALEVTTSRPSAFETLTLGAPAIAGGPVERAVGLRYKELAELYDRCGAGPWMTELWMRRPPDTFAYTSPALHSQLAAVINRHTWSELANPNIGLVGLTRERQNAEGLAYSTARQLYLIGEYELPAFQRTVAILRGIRPDARCVELEGAGHLCLLHAPRQIAPLLVEHWSTPAAATVASA